VFVDLVAPKSIPLLPHSCPAPHSPRSSCSHHSRATWLCTTHSACPRPARRTSTRRSTSRPQPSPRCTRSNATRCCCAYLATRRCWRAGALSSSLAFIPGHGGVVHTAEEIYDPLVGDLHLLLDSAAHFPQAPFNTPEVVAVMCTLGLKKRLDRSGVLESALSVFKLGSHALDVTPEAAEEFEQQARTRSRALSRTWILTPCDCSPMTPRPPRRMCRNHSGSPRFW
jgi:hypothetical protein